MYRELLKKLARELDAAGVPYMVFGGQAVVRHGVPRFTADVDITVGLDPSQAAPVLRAVRLCRLQVLVSDVDEFLRQTFVLPTLDTESGTRVDLVFSLTPYERQAIERAGIFRLDGVPVRFVAVEDLIVMKLLAARPRDIEDVAGVILKNPSFDRPYVEQWLRQFDSELDTQLMRCFEQVVQRTAQRRPPKDDDRP